jgi:hypothetical protein
VSDRSKKIREKGPAQTQRAPIVKSLPPASAKGDLVVISTSLVPSTSVKEPHKIGSPPFSQAKFPKGTRTRFCWKEGLPANFLDSVSVYLPGHASIMKSGDVRPALGDLSEYAREAVRAVESPYFAHNIEDVPATLTTAMGNVFEAFSLMGRIRDDYVTREGKVTFPKIQSNDLSKAVVERDYLRGQVTGLNKNLGLLKGENKQIKEQAQKIKEESAKALEEALQRATATEARAAEAEAYLAEVRGKIVQAESDLTTKREVSEKLKPQLSEASSS